MASVRNFLSAGPRASMSFNVRRARAVDAEEAAAVLRASISALCVADHGGDPVVLTRWLANKTPQDVRTWIEGSGRFVIAEERGRIEGVGAAIASGEITLNYVLPGARYCGVSKAVLRALETHLRTQGRTRSTLCSTRTAHRFYRTMGYVDEGKPEIESGLAANRMFKDLSTRTHRHDPPPLAVPSGG